MIWSDGLGSLSVINRKNFTKVNSIEDFWMHDTGICRPFAACSNKSASRILGASLDQKGDYILHYYESNGHNEYLVSDKVNAFFPQMIEVKALEVDSTGEVAFLAGISSTTGKTMVLAVELDRNLNLINGITLDEMDYGKPRRLKRIKGYDILLVGCKGIYAVLQYNNNNSFYLITNLVLSDNKDIVDFEFRDGILYSKGYKKDNISVLNFNTGATADYLNEPPANLPKSNLAISSYPSANDGGDLGYSGLHPVQPNNLNTIDAASFGAKDEVHAVARDPGPVNVYTPNVNNTKSGKIETGRLGTEKIAVALDARRIYFGGQGLNILQINNNRRYELLNNPKLKGKLFFVFSQFLIFLEFLKIF